MTKTHRRNFLKHSMLGAAALGWSSRQTDHRSQAVAAEDDGQALLIDVNVNIHGWPFRKLKYGETPDLVAKLRKHRVKQAWCGSYDALFHKNIDHVNSRLAEDCCRLGQGVLLAFGTVNPAFPDWEEDLRRCHEVYNMPGIKLHPGYHGYQLDDARFKQLLQGAARRGLLVQIAIDMEDERIQHPLVDVPAVDVTPLPAVMQEIPDAQVMLVNPFRHVRGARLRAMVERTNAVFEFSNLDGVAGLQRVLQGTHWYLRDIVIPLERLVFGSHFPYFPLENALLKLIESPLTREQIDAFAYRNAERIVQATQV